MTAKEKAERKRKRESWLADRETHKAMVTAARKFKDSDVTTDDLRRTIALILKDFGYRYNCVHWAEALGVPGKGDTDAQKAQSSQEHVARFMADKATRSDMLAFLVLYPVTPERDYDNETRRLMNKEASRFGVQAGVLPKKEKK